MSGIPDMACASCGRLVCVTVVMLPARKGEEEWRLGACCFGEREKDATQTKQAAAPTRVLL